MRCASIRTCFPRRYGQDAPKAAKQILQATGSDTIYFISDGAEGPRGWRVRCLVVLAHHHRVLCFAHTLALHTLTGCIVGSLHT